MALASVAGKTLYLREIKQSCYLAGKVVICMHGIAFATFVCLIWLVNLFLTWLQIKQHKRLMGSLIHTYTGMSDMYLSSGVYRKFMRPMSHVFVVVNDKYVVMECRLKKGKTVFAQYHKVGEWIGEDVRTIISELEELNHDRKSLNRTDRIAMIQACKQAVQMVRGQNVRQTSDSASAALI